MTIPFQAEGQLLPVSPWLKSQLAEMVSEQCINLEPLTALTFRFNDPNYSATQGGYHPVEIRLVHQGDEWCLDYATDFGYVGNAYPELEKIIDISWSQGYVWHCRTGDLSPSEARALYTLWERNFLSYHASGVYTTRVMWES